MRLSLPDLSSGVLLGRSLRILLVAIALAVSLPSHAACVLNGGCCGGANPYHNSPHCCSDNACSSCTGPCLVNLCCSGSGACNATSSTCYANTACAGSVCSGSPELPLGSLSRLLLLAICLPFVPLVMKKKKS